jgi:EAL domain-containing protein (putative c-di-GMP-specific phosphodiesterase class I)
MHLSPGRITLELTETQPLNNLSLSLENAIRLRVMGFNLALDDFGAGYSGFHHLREIPANSVKIDRLLMHQAAGDPAAESCWVLPCACCKARMFRWWSRESAGSRILSW